MSCTVKVKLTITLTGVKLPIVMMVEADEAASMTDVLVQALQFSAQEIINQKVLAADQAVMYSDKLIAKG
jgi:hypothetical protein